MGPWGSFRRGAASQRNYPLKRERVGTFSPSPTSGKEIEFSHQWLMI